MLNGTPAECIDEGFESRAARSRIEKVHISGAVIPYGVADSREQFRPRERLGEEARVGPT